MKVDAGITSVAPNDVVRASTHNNTDTTKASYTVPVNKELFITVMWGTTRKGEFLVQVQEDGTPFHDMAINKDGASYTNITLPTETPYGPFSAGTVISIERVEGQGGQEWSAGWVGYLRDV